MKILGGVCGLEWLLAVLVITAADNQLARAFRRWPDPTLGLIPAYLHSRQPLSSPSAASTKPAHFPSIGTLLRFLPFPETEGSVSPALPFSSPCSSFPRLFILPASLHFLSAPPSLSLRLCCLFSSSSLPSLLPFSSRLHPSCSLAPPTPNPCRLPSSDYVQLKGRDLLKAPSALVVSLEVSVSVSESGLAGVSL